MGGFETLLSVLRDGAEAITSDPLAGAGTWLLAGVFIVAGLTKLRRPGVAAMALVDFGVAARPVPAVGAALGAVELALALSIASGAAPALALGAAAVLLLLFAVLIAKALLAGESFACFCLGDDDSGISAWTLGRTAALAALAAALAANASPTAPPLSGTPALDAAAGAALLGTAMLAARVPRLLSWDPFTIGEAR